MNHSELVAFISQQEDVQQEENYGYDFFFVGDDHRLPFVTIANTDNEYETVSSLNREGVFRLNIGVSKKSFDDLFANLSSENIDYTALDVFMPHPDYAKQHFICILNPSEKNEELTKKFIREAHSIATARHQKLSKAK